MTKGVLDMKVWAVICINYEEKSISGIYSTKELAQTEIDKYRWKDVGKSYQSAFKNGYDPCVDLRDFIAGIPHIEEIELDSPLNIPDSLLLKHEEALIKYNKLIKIKELESEIYKLQNS